MTETELKMVQINDVITGKDWLEKIDNLNENECAKVDLIVSAIECPKEYLALFQELVKLIERLMRKHLRSNTIKAASFGSVVMDLAIKNSDLDMFINLDSKYPKDENTMRLLRKIFYRADFTEVFKSVFLVYAKVPILKCVHEMGFECDISINNGIAERNSQLLHFYISLNKSFRPFFMLLKLWMKRINLITLYGFKSYTFCLMAIFYLQDKQILPSVHFLQNHPSAPKPEYLDDWNAAFLNDRTLFKDVEEKEFNVMDLLSDFFLFYSKFEFGFFTISPVMGKAYLKPFRNFLPSFDLKADLFEQFQDETYISVQDVFQLNYNTSSGVGMPFVIDFQENCKRAAEICGDSNRKRLFERLFEPVLKRNRKKGGKKNFVAPGKWAATGNNEDEVRRNWINRVLEEVEYVLVNVALATINARKDGVIECSTDQPVHLKQLRKEIGCIIENELANSEKETGEKRKLHGLKLQEAISQRIKNEPHSCFATHIDFSINYSVTVAPTRFFYDVTVPCKKDSNMQQFANLASSVSRWLGEIRNV